MQYYKLIRAKPNPNLNPYSYYYYVTFNPVSFPLAKLVFGVLYSLVTLSQKHVVSYFLRKTYPYDAPTK